MSTATKQPQTNRLRPACEAAFARLVAKEMSGIDPDIFVELGETLFWLCALADAQSCKHPLLRGLAWARNQIAHGHLITKPAEWQYGAEPGRAMPGRARPGVRSEHMWLDRSEIPLIGGWPQARNETAYDQYVAGKPVVKLLNEALTQLR